MENDSKWLIIALVLLLIVGAGVLFFMHAEEEAQQRQTEAEARSLHAVIQHQEAEIARLRAMVEEKKDK
ncbi:MAG: hypothetical protein ACYTG5_03080 [Planctomycetota bacterium]|jgi:Tfp pilus assembly protein PilO